jgi:hypothetical protein
MAVKASRQAIEFHHIELFSVAELAGLSLYQGSLKTKQRGGVSKLSANTRLPLPFRGRWTTTKSISKSAVTMVKKVPK